jgi:hypothetical protein
MNPLKDLLSYLEKWDAWHKIQGSATTVAMYEDGTIDFIDELKILLNNKIDADASASQCVESSQSAVECDIDPESDVELSDAEFDPTEATTDTDSDVEIFDAESVPPQNRIPLPEDLYVSVAGDIIDSICSGQCESLPLADARNIKFKKHIMPLILDRLGWNNALHSMKQVSAQKMQQFLAQQQANHAEQSPEQQHAETEICALPYSELENNEICAQQLLQQENAENNGNTANVEDCAFYGEMSEEQWAELAAKAYSDL